MKKISVSPSGADRWMTCTMSPHFIAEHWDKLDHSEKDYSKEGTLAHEMGAKLLKGVAIPDDAWPDLEMKLAMMEYVEWVKTLSKNVMVETEVPLWYMPERHGIIDVCFVTDNCLTIVDLKYGKGVEVEVQDNLQLLIYAVSMLDYARGMGIEGLDDDPQLVMYIYQPRCGDQADGGGPPQPWTVRESEVGELVNQIEKVSYDIMQKRSLVFAPSDKACKFCDAAELCPARMDHLLEITGFTVETMEEHHADDEDFPLPNPESMTPQQMRIFIERKTEFKKWLDKVEANITARMSVGEHIEGLKLVLGRGGNRTWNDLEAAKVLLYPKLAGDVWEKKLISPAQAEKLLKPLKPSVRFQNRFEELVSRSPGRPKVVSVSDKLALESPSLMAEDIFEELPPLVTPRKEEEWKYGEDDE